MKTYAEICEMKSMPKEVEWANKEMKKLDAAIEKYAWDGEWFVRAYNEATKSGC